VGKYKRILFIGLILILVLGVGAFLFFHFKGKGEAPPIVAKVERGEIQRLLSFSGSVSHINQIDLAPKVSGRVGEILVKVGDRVEQGQELLKIEIPDLEYQISQAQLNLNSAILRLKQLQEGPSPEEKRVLELSVEKAQQDLEKAQENYQRVLETTTYTSSVAENAVKIAERRLEEAKENLELTKMSVSQSIDIAQLSVDQASEDVENSPTQALKDQAERKLELAKEQLEAQKLAGEQQIKMAESQVRSAEDALDQAKQNLEQKTLANRDLVAQAESTLQSAEMALKIAQAQLDQRLAIQSETSLELQKTAIEQTQLTLNNLLKQKEDSLIRSPAPGIVGSLSVKVGDPVMVNTPILSLVDLDLLEIQANIPEVNIGLLRPSMEATVRADAFPDLEFKATLSYFNPLASVSQGVVNYIAHFDLEKAAMGLLKPGMTVELEIVVEKSSNTLIIPRPALHQEDQGDFVYVWDGKQMELRKVKTGIQNEIQVEIKEGLKEGEEVVLSLKSATFSFSSTPFSAQTP
jgi:RND family efflux transporter MFP subunit